MLLTSRISNTRDESNDDDDSVTATAITVFWDGGYTDNYSTDQPIAEWQRSNNAYVSRSGHHQATDAGHGQALLVHVYIGYYKMLLLRTTWKTTSFPSKAAYGSAWLEGRCMWQSSAIIIVFWFQALYLFVLLIDRILLGDILYNHWSIMTCCRSTPDML